MKKLHFLLSATALIATPLSAKAWTVGQQSISYPASGVHGTILAPNTAPAYAYQLADIPSNFTEANWIHSGGTAGGQFDAPPTAGESKGRFDCGPTILSDDDSLLFFNILNGSPHKHEVMGNYQAVTQGYFNNLDYNALRSAGNSTCYGGPDNRSNYWEPAVQKLLTNGVLAFKKALNFVTYYIGSGDTTARTGGSIDDVDKVSVWPRGWETIGGVSPGAPGNAARTALLAIAGSGYSYAEADALFTPGFQGWYCETGVGGNGSVATSPVAGYDHQPWLRNGDGTPTLNCATSGSIVADFNTAACWDAVNLDSPDERSHVAYPIRDNGLSGNFARKCPQNWAVIPTLEVKTFFTHAGQADYTAWWFSSDRMVGMNFGTVTAAGSGTTLTTTAATSSMLVAKWHSIVGTGIPANTMITNVSGSVPNLTLTLSQSVTGTITSEAMTIPFNGGETGHFDVTPAWPYGTAAAPSVFLRMMQHCPGLTITQGSTGGAAATLTGDPHLCGSGRIDATEQLFTAEASPDASAPNPILVLTPDRSGKNGYWPLTSHTPIPGHVQNSH